MYGVDNIRVSGNIPTELEQDNPQGSCKNRRISDAAETAIGAVGARESSEPIAPTLTTIPADVIDGSRKINSLWIRANKLDDTSGSGDFLWEYLYNNKVPGETGIDIYTYNCQLALDMYPAVEPHPDYLRQVVFGKTNWQSGKLTSKDIPWEDLGFSIKLFGNFVLPTATTLLSRWKLIKDAGVVKHDLKLVSSEGIASHREFITSYCNYDGLVSSGPEFVHDMLIHIVPLICRIFSCESGGRNYETVRTKCGLTISKILRKLDALENLNQASSVAKEIDVLVKHKNLLIASYGLAVDSVTTIYSDKFFTSSLQGPVEIELVDVFSGKNNTILARVFKEEMKDLPADSPVREDVKKGILSLWHTFEQLDL